MRGMKCAFSTAAALHRVFIAPIERSPLQLLQWTRPALHPHSSHAVSSQRRRYAAIIMNTHVVAEKSRLPRNEEIPTRLVRVVGEHKSRSDGDEIGVTMTLRDALRNLDRKEDQLQVVVMEPEDGGPPLCRIQNMQQMREQEKIHRKKLRQGSQGIGQKQIELNWAIDQRGDLKHRLKKMQDFLRKGMKVEVVLAGKKGGRRATEEEAREVVKKVMEAVNEVEGAKQTAEPDGQYLKVMTLKLVGKKPKEAKEAVVVEEVDGVESAASVKQVEPVKKAAPVKWDQPQEKVEPMKWDHATKNVRPTKKTQPAKKGRAPIVPPNANPAWEALQRAVKAGR